MNKICCSCKKSKDISLFSKNKNSKDGYKNYCKECASIQGKIYREKHREKVLESKQQWYKKTKEIKEERTKKELDKGTRICSECKIEKNIENFYERPNGGFHSKCKECTLKIQKEYYIENRDKMILRKREYHKNAKQKIDEYNRNYYLKNSDYIKMRVKKWRIDNPEQNRETKRKNTQERLMRKNELISNFSKNDWKECKDYFRNKKGELECAYCGKILKKATQEHFIPVSKGGNYTRNNIIPVCMSCNCSKCDKDFEEWYKTKNFYSEKRKQKIYNYLYKHANTVPSL